MESGVKQRIKLFIEHKGISIREFERSCGLSNDMVIQKSDVLFMGLVAFCLNHASAHKVTELYIVKDFTKIDTLNQQVIERIFNYKTVCNVVLSIVVSLLEFREGVNLMQGYF